MKLAAVRNWAFMSRPTDSSPPPSSFEELIRQASQGSEEAVWLLLERYSKNILRVVRRHLPTEIRSKVDSTDIVQSVWKSLIRTGANLDSSATPEQFIAYLAGIARFKVYETHRHYTTMKAYDVKRERSFNSLTSPRDGASTRQQDLDPQDRRAQEPLDIVSTREMWRRAIELSGDRGRRIVELRLQGLTLAEVADRLQISLSTVRRSLDELFTSVAD